MMYGGLGETECQKLHARYADSLRAYESAVHAIEECRTAHLGYEAALAAQERARAAQAECQVIAGQYQALLQEAENCRMQVGIWSAAAGQFAAAQTAYETYRKKVAAENKAIDADNTAARNAWISKKASVESTNASRKQKYEAALSAYSAALAKYQAYRAQVALLRAQTQAKWDSIRKVHPFLNNSSGYPVRVMCDGTGFSCITEAQRKQWGDECLVIRGLDGGALGATQASGKCSWMYMPVCPSCPPAVANPGSVPPTAPKYDEAPAQPTPTPHMTVLSWDQWLSTQGSQPRDPGPKPTCNPNGPTSGPTCDPSAPIPGLPGDGSRPSCTVPSYTPTKPVAPACDPKAGLFSGTSAMWFVAAAVGGGLYYLSKRK